MSRSKQESIYRRADGRWVAVLELPSKNGKRRRRYLYASTEKGVKQRLKHERRILEERGDLSTSSPTVEGWFTYWLQHIAPNQMRPKSLQQYQKIARNHIIPEIGKRRLARLTPDDIRMVHERVLSTPKRKSDPEGPTLTGAYALSVHWVMSKAFRVAEREGKLGRNPCDLVDPPRKGKTKLEVLDVDEAKAVLKRIAECMDAPGPYDPMPALYATYLLTAKRRGEALGLQWPRVTSNIEVTKQLQQITNPEDAPEDYEMEHLGGTYYLVPVKSFRGNRVIPLVEPLRTILAIHSERAPYSEHGLVFCNRDGSPISPGHVTTAWPRWLKATGITQKHVRLHDLRHTTVDLLYEAGVPEDLIPDIVGHSTRMQSRAYKVRRNDARLTSAMEALSGLLA